MLAEIEKDQDTVSVNRISSGNFRSWRQSPQQNFHPRAPSFGSYARPAFYPRSAPPQQNLFPCQLCLQAGKPEYAARSHSTAQCQSSLPRNRPNVPRHRTPAMRLIAAPVPDISEESLIDPLAQNIDHFSFVFVMLNV